MFPRLPDPATQSQDLSAALRSIRRRRGLKVRQVAKAMGLGLRTYERFEAGEGEIRADRIFTFAAVTNSDPFALFAVLYFGAAELGTRGADNKIMLVHAMALKRFDAELGDALSELDVATLIVAFSKTYEELAQHLRTRRELTQKWLEGDDPSKPPPKAEPEEPP